MKCMGIDIESDEEVKTDIVDTASSCGGGADILVVHILGDAHLLPSSILHPWLI